MIWKQICRYGIESHPVCSFCTSGSSGRANASLFSDRSTSVSGDGLWPIVVRAAGGLGSALRGTAGRVGEAGPGAGAGSACVESGGSGCAGGEGLVRDGACGANTGAGVGVAVAVGGSGCGRGGKSAATSGGMMMLGEIGLRRVVGCRQVSNGVTTVCVRGVCV